MTELVSVPIHKIICEKVMIKNQLDKDLLASIKHMGLLMPLEVRKDGDFYEVLDGKRRLACLKLLKATNVLCIIQIVDATEIIASIHSNKTSLFELGKIVKRILDQKMIKIKELARRIDKSESTIRRWIRIYEQEK